MPRWVAPTLILLASLALVPVACIARARAVKSSVPRVHLIQDMDNQGRFKSQQRNRMFADARAMRPPVPGTVARGGLRGDDAYFRGVDGDAYVTDFPARIRIERTTIERGRREFDIYCAPCHGLAGHGDGIVGKRAEALEQGTWVPPASFHVEPAASRPVGHLYNTIANGIRNMPSYGSQIEVADRWAIVMYVKALQRSQRARLDDVPAAERPRLR